jgi:hypothetical protein
MHRIDTFGVSVARKRPSFCLGVKKLEKTDFLEPEAGLKEEIWMSLRNAVLAAAIMPFKNSGFLMPSAMCCAGRA